MSQISLYFSDWIRSDSSSIVGSGSLYLCFRLDQIRACFVNCLIERDQSNQMHTFILWVGGEGTYLGILWEGVYSYSKVVLDFDFTNSPGGGGGCVKKFKILEL